MIYNIDEVSEDQIESISLESLPAHLSLLVFIPEDGIFYKFVMGIN